MGGGDQVAKVAAAEDQDVLDDFVRWRDVREAVMPSELQQLEQVERSLSPLLSEHLDDAGPTITPALRPTHGHARVWHRRTVLSYLRPPRWEPSVGENQRP